MDSVKKLRDFIKHWYIRYLVSTELYMVEPWEKVVIPIFFTLFWYFNYSIIVSAISNYRESSGTVAEL